jgi:hypothetical protein
MPAPVTLATILSHIDRDALHDLACRMHDAGEDPDAIVHAVVEAIDAAVPWAVLGPVGALVEVVDGPIAEFIARLIVHAAIAGKQHHRRHPARA